MILIFDVLFTFGNAHLLHLIFAYYLFIKNVHNVLIYNWPV